MNTITAALCKNPVIGMAMWLMTLCATNQALKEAFIDLGSTGTLITESFQAPMDEEYGLQLLLRTDQSGQSAQDLNWQKLLCKPSNNESTETMPLDVSIRISDASGKSYLTQNFRPACQRPNFEEGRTLSLGKVLIKQGSYRAELINNAALNVLAGKRIQVLLVGEGAGYP
jgi:hypothetical protein